MNKNIILIGTGNRDKIDYCSLSQCLFLSEGLSFLVCWLFN